MLPIIQSLWVGEDLTNLEKLCIQSFLDNGHEFHLYAYTDIGGVPDGAIVKDGNEILPERKIFQHKGGSYAGFADWFRYAMLAKLGGFWVDMDIVCIKPFNFVEDIVLVHRIGRHYSNCLIGVPPNNPMIVALEKYCRNLKNHEGSPWGSVGGMQIFNQFIDKFGMSRHAKPFTYVAPFTHEQWTYTFSATINVDDLYPSTHGIHFFNEKLRLIGVDKNSSFDKESLFEKLKTKHGIVTDPSAPIVTSTQLMEIKEDYRYRRLRRRKRRIRRQLILYMLFALLCGVGVGMLV